MELAEIHEVNADNYGGEEEIEVLLGEEIKLGGKEESTVSIASPEVSTIDESNSPVLSVKGELYIYILVVNYNSQSFF